MTRPVVLRGNRFCKSECWHDTRAFPKSKAGVAVLGMK